MNAQLIDEADVKKGKDKYLVLAFDEMKIREDLVFDKHSGSLLCFVSLGDVTNVLDDFERQCSVEGDGTAEMVATHMLTFMLGEFSLSSSSLMLTFLQRVLQLMRYFPLYGML